MKSRISFLFVSLCFVFSNVVIAEKFGQPAYSDVSIGCDYGSTSCYLSGYYHAGIDYRSNASLDVMAVNCGIVVRVEKMSSGDHGMGNNIIIGHMLTNRTIAYSTYSHLASIESNIIVGAIVTRGQKIGVMGASGYGNLIYWIEVGGGKHLHFEMKTTPVTGDLNNASWGYMTSYPDNHGYLDPNDYFDIIDAVDINSTVGFYPDGFHSDGSSQAFAVAFNQFKPKIGWPISNGPCGIYVHEWEGQTSSSFSVICQDFLGDTNSDHYGTDARSMLILNDLETPKKAYLLKEGFLEYYCNNDGPYEFGVPTTNEILEGKYANSHLVSINDFIQPSSNYCSPKMITVQKFKRRLATETRYIYF